MTTEINRPLMTVNTLATLRQIIPIYQFGVIHDLMSGEEREFFTERLVHLEQVFNNIPKSGTSNDGGKAIVHLHYFSPGCDWWITEKDCDTEQRTFYGLADMGCREFGYIDMVDLLRNRKVEIDLHWEPVAVETLIK